MLLRYINVNKNAKKPRKHSVIYRNNLFLSELFLKSLRSSLSSLHIRGYFNNTNGYVVIGKQIITRTAMVKIQIISMIINDGRKKNE
jgi:hypothetical protein